MSRVPLAMLVLLGLSVVSAAAVAEIPDLTWMETEVVDAPVGDLPAGGGASIVLHEGVWYVAYLRSGQVTLARRDAVGWQEPLIMTEDPAIPGDPHLAVSQGALHLVWQDDRSGHPEVWTRRYESGSWTAPAGLTDDAVPSSAPAVAGLGASARVVWQEDVGDAARIRSRRFESGVWGPSEPVSLGGAAATEPTISANPDDYWYYSYYVSWTDARHGSTEIYRRVGEEVWDAELRLTNLAGVCRRPSIAAEACCSDYLLPASSTAFEYVAPGGVPEIWSAAVTFGTPSIAPVSPDDGVPSTMPNASGNEFNVSGCWFGGGFARYWISWIDEPAPGSREVRLARTYESGGPVGTDLVSPAATGRAAVAGGESTPDAVMIAWCELRDGVPTLLARRGSVPSCSVVGLRLSPSLLLAPEGLPANVLQRIDVCTGEELTGSGATFGLSFSSALEAALAWDPLQEHPLIGVEAEPDGRVLFAVRGGGCSQAGPATVHCEIYGPPDGSWTGARSPDVDGDCAVRLDDLAYVEAALGSSDFCADLDGSGLVDAADLAIVQATMGDHCSNLTAVDGAEESAVLGLSIAPNPARATAVVRLRGVGKGPVALRVVDVGGRVVREHQAAAEGGSARWSWDTRDELGRPAVSGLYTILASSGGRSVRQRLLVLR